MVGAQSDTRKFFCDYRIKGAHPDSDLRARLGLLLFTVCWRSLESRMLNAILNNTVSFVFRPTDLARYDCPIPTNVLLLLFQRSHGILNQAF